MKKLFAGIDISKNWIDVAVTLDGKMIAHQQFSNDKAGFTLLMKWLRSFNGNKDQWLLCMEHTGIYAQPLWLCLSLKQISYSVVAGSLITSGLEIRRGKTDKIDAADIARFTYRHREELKPFTLPAQLLQRLKMMFAYRERLVKAKKLIMVPAAEAKVFAPQVSKEVRTDSCSLVQILEARIKKVEKLMLEIITSDEKVKQVYELIVSVPGFGLITASYLLIITNCFTVLTSSRKLANFGGVAPHPHKSGTSIKGKTRTSPIADKKLKALLSNGVGSLIQHHVTTQQYYQRLIAKGKNENLVKNNIKNKMLHVVCTIVKRGVPYQKEYVSPLQQVA
jgi:transposase